MCEAVKNKKPLEGKKVFITSGNEKGSSIVRHILYMGGEVVQNPVLYNNADLLVFASSRDVMNFTAIAGNDLRSCKVCSVDKSASQTLLEHRIFPFAVIKSDKISSVMESLVNLC